MHTGLARAEKKIKTFVCCQCRVLQYWYQHNHRLKTQHSEDKIMVSSPITSWQIDGETMKTVTLYFLGFQNHG